MELVAKTFQGLEDVLAEELRQLGAEDVTTGTRMVSFKGDKALMYRANFAAARHCAFLNQSTRSPRQTPMSFTVRQNFSTGNNCCRPKRLSPSTPPSTAMTSPLEVCHIPRERRHRRFLHREIRQAPVNPPDKRRHSAERAYLPRQGDAVARLIRRVAPQTRIPRDADRRAYQRGARRRTDSENRLARTEQLHRPDVHRAHSSSRQP